MADYERANPGGGLDGKTLVLQAVDIVQLVGETVGLTKRGRSFVGLCPFHNEKTPSFHVHPDRGFFHCFGCKASGNAIDFVIKRDRVEFVEALQILARKYNIELPRMGIDKQSTGLRQRLLDAHSAAAAYFQQNLAHASIGKPARDYLAKRGFNDETIKKFQIGLSLQSWDGLIGSPSMRKFDRELLLTAGLVKPPREGGNKPYDTFRDRLMFPIRDDGGRVIAFGGRIMPGSDNPAKYLNSPETPLFSKSKVAYGLDMARQRIVETKTVAIVEGYTDVVMAHQFGASNVVSVLGTALTEQHVTLLRRFAERIVLLFDGDDAGDLAVDRALQLFLTQPIEITIATLPGGMDPDEYLLQHGVEGFDKLLAGAEDALSFQWRQLFKQLQVSENDLTGRTKAVESYLERLSAARSGGPVDPMRWGAILARVSKFTQIPVEDLNRRFKARRPIQTPVRPGETAIPAKNRAPAVRIPNARRQAERWILGGLFNAPEAWHHVQQIIDCTEFMAEELRPLAEWYWDYQRHEGQPVLGELIAALHTDDLKSLVIELANEVEAMNNAHQTLAEAVEFVQQEKHRLEQTKLLGQLRRTQSERNDVTEVDLLRQFSEAARARTNGHAG
jgi:DNA primase